MNFALRRTISETVPKSVHFPDFWGQDKAVHLRAPRGLVTSARRDKRETRFLKRNHKNR